ncbi:hypothetical protein GN956_G21807 [Arapaima gigas]
MISLKPKTFCIICFCPCPGSERILRSHQLILSRSMTSCLVDVICSYLSSKQMVTDFEGQVVRSQPTEFQMASQLLQVLLRKGSKACQQFYEALECFDPVLFTKVTGAPGGAPSTDFPHPRLLAGTWGPAPTYIVNIHNSTLTSCIIGNNNGQCVSRDPQCAPSQSPDPSGSGKNEEAARGSCLCGQKGAAQAALTSASLEVHDSNLEYVIIGENNSLTVEEELVPGEMEE